jgi:hypothetical protein
VEVDQDRLVGADPRRVVDHGGVERNNRYVVPPKGSVVNK